MQGRIKSKKSFDKLLGFLKQAKDKSNTNKKPECLVFQDMPKNLNDDQLMEAADRLRDERNALAKRMIQSGLLDPDWAKDTNVR